MNLQVISANGMPGGMKQILQINRDLHRKCPCRHMDINYTGEKSLSKIEGELSIRSNKEGVDHLGIQVENKSELFEIRKVISNSNGSFTVPITFDLTFTTQNKPISLKQFGECACAHGKVIFDTLVAVREGG